VHGTIDMSTVAGSDTDCLALTTNIDCCLTPGNDDTTFAVPADGWGWTEHAAAAESPGGASKRRSGLNITFQFLRNCRSTSVTGRPSSEAAQPQHQSKLARLSVGLFTKTLA